MTKDGKEITYSQHLDDVCYGAVRCQLITEHLHTCVVEIVVGRYSSQRRSGHSMVVLRSSYWSILGTVIRL